MSVVCANCKHKDVILSVTTRGVTVYFCDACLYGKRIAQWLAREKPWYQVGLEI